jgi:RNA polymerase primary sigma factor
VANDAQGPDRDDELRRYLEEAARFPVLSKDAEIRLAQAVEAGDEGARRRLVESNLRLVVAVARRFGPSVVLTDAIQAGNMGLRRAT